MRLEIEIPKKFEIDFNEDKFSDFFNRCIVDMSWSCGLYEKEIAEMFILVFDRAKKIE